jgi:hypothetical protein
MAKEKQIDHPSHHGIARDEKAQEQPTDKARAQQVNRKDRKESPWAEGSAVGGFEMLYLIGRAFLESRSRRIALRRQGRRDILLASIPTMTFAS